MTRWEYQLQAFPIDELMPGLNAFGVDGWEAVAIVQDPTGRSDFLPVLMKREKAPVKSYRIPGGRVGTAV